MSKKPVLVCVPVHVHVDGRPDITRIADYLVGRDKVHIEGLGVLPRDLLSDDEREALRRALREARTMSAAQAQQQKLT